MIDKGKPSIELKGEEAKKAMANNPLIPIGQAINNHAKTLSELRTAMESFQIDMKADKATMEIFDRRFGLVERQLDNIERKLIEFEKRFDKE